MPGSFELSCAILAGGLGTRLRSVVSDRPKVLAEVAGRPFITYLLDQVERAGIREVVLCTGYQADKLSAVLGTSYRTLNLVYSAEEQPLGTGGAIRLALPRLIGSHVLLMNGDSYGHEDLGGFADWYFSVNREIGMMIVQVPDASRFGRVRVGKNGAVQAFEEKRGDGLPGMINSGVYIIAKSLLSSIPSGQTFSLEKDVFPRHLEKSFFAFPSQGPFIDIGLPETFVEAQAFFQSLTEPGI